MSLLVLFISAAIQEIIETIDALLLNAHEGVKFR